MGFVWNARYLQMIDAILGIAMIDICGDDGYPVGEWSFPYRTGSAEPEEDASWEEEEVEEEDEVEEPVSDEDAELEELLESLERQRKELEAGKRR